MVLSNLDRDLLRFCLEKQTGSWEAFVERFLGLVQFVVRSSAGARGFEISDIECSDLVADVFSELRVNDMAILKQFREQSSLGTYLVVVSRRIAVRRLQQHRRKPSNHDESSTSTNSSTNPTLAATSSPISELAETTQPVDSAVHPSGDDTSPSGEWVQPDKAAATAK